MQENCDKSLDDNISALSAFETVDRVANVNSSRPVTAQINAETRRVTSRPNHAITAHRNDILGGWVT